MKRAMEKSRQKKGSLGWEFPILTSVIGRFTVPHHVIS